MFLFNGSFRMNSKTIRGVQYVVVSHYSDSELLFDRLGNMIEDSFQHTNPVDITNPSLVVSDMAIPDE